MFKAIWRFIKLMFNTLFLEPVRGGNGVTALDELGKYIVIWITAWAIYYEAVTVGSQFTDPQFIAILSLLAAIIGVQLFFKNKKNNNEHE